MKVKFPRRTVAGLMKKWIYDRKKFWKASKDDKINGPYTFEILKSRNLVTKELINDIKKYFDINIHPIFVRSILIKFVHWSHMNPKNVYNSSIEEEKITMGTSASKSVLWPWLENLAVLWTSSYEINSATQVQMLGQAVCISQL